MSSNNNILKNGFANVLQKLLRVLEQIVLVPFFIIAWGSQYYGEWITLTIVPSVLVFSDLGFGSAAASTFVLRYAAGDKKGAADIAKTGPFVISIVVLIGILITGATLMILHYFNLLEKSVIPAREAIIAISFMMVSKLLNFFQQFYDSFFRAARRASKSINLTNGFMLVNIMVGFGVLKMGGGIISFAFANLVVSLIFNPTYALLAYREINLNEIRNASINKSDISQSFKIGAGYLLSPLWQAIFFQGSTFVVRLVLGPTAVALFNTVRTLSRSVNQLYTIINGSVFPELQYEIGQGNMVKARKIYGMAILTTLALAIGGVIFLAIFGLYFYNIWTRNELTPPASMWWLFIIGIGINALWWTAGVIFRAVNKPYPLNIAGICSAVISVALTYFLSKMYGITGAAIGMLTLDVLMAIYVVPIAGNLLGRSVILMVLDARSYSLSRIRNILRR